MSPDTATAPGTAPPAASPAPRPIGRKGGQSTPTKERRAGGPTVRLGLALLVAVAVVGAVALYVWQPRSSLPEARQRLARIESVRLLRRLDRTRSQTIALARRTEGALLLSVLSMPEEDRRQLDTLREILTAPSAPRPPAPALPAAPAP